MAEASAGDQNTNMYKLNTRTDYLVKKLKKIDEYVSKNKNDISALGISSLDDVTMLEQKNKEQLQNKRLLENVTKAASAPATLKIVVKPDVYSSLLAVNDMRDAEIAASLQRQFRGAKK